jgi:phosphomannomutase/phosphoglucomutase
LMDSADFTNFKEIVALDGLRVEYADGFGLARASNTTPAIVLRFEADTEAALQRIQDNFRRIFKRAAPHLLLPF